MPNYIELKPQDILASTYSIAFVERDGKKVKYIGGGEDVEVEYGSDAAAKAAVDAWLLQANASDMDRIATALESIMATQIDINAKLEELPSLLAKNAIVASGVWDRMLVSAAKAGRKAEDDLDAQALLITGV